MALPRFVHRIRPSQCGMSRVYGMISVQSLVLASVWSTPRVDEDLLINFMMLFPSCAQRIRFRKKTSVQFEQMRL
jgi:hypothetical protein